MAIDNKNWNTIVENNRSDLSEALRDIVRQYLFDSKERRVSLLHQGDIAVSEDLSMDPDHALDVFVGLGQGIMIDIDEWLYAVYRLYGEDECDKAQRIWVKTGDINDYLSVNSCEKRHDVLQFVINDFMSRFDPNELINNAVDYKNKMEELFT